MKRPTEWRHYRRMLNTQEHRRIADRYGIEFYYLYQSALRKYRRALDRLARGHAPGV